MHIPFPEYHTRRFAIRMYAFPSCLLSVAANHARAMASSGTCVTISRKAVCTHGGDEVTGAHGVQYNQSDLFFYALGVPVVENSLFTDALGPGYSMRVSVYMSPNLTVLSVRNGGLTWAMSQTAHELRPFVSCNPAAMIRCPKISKAFSVIAVIRGSFCLQAEALRVQNGGCMCRMVSRAKCVCF